MSIISQKISSNVAEPLLYLGIAALGSRYIHHFPKSNANGLLFSSTAGCLADTINQLVGHQPKNPWIKNSREVSCFFLGSMVAPLLIPKQFAQRISLGVFDAFKLSCYSATTVALFILGLAMLRERNILSILENVSDKTVNWEKVPEGLKQDAPFMLRAAKVVLEQVSNKTVNWDKVPEELKQDAPFMLRAAKEDIEATKHAADSLKKNATFILSAIKIDRRACEYADDSLKKSSEFILDAMKIFPEDKKHKAIKYADNTLKDNDVFMESAEKIHKLAKNYASDRIKYAI